MGEIILFPQQKPDRDRGDCLVGLVFLQGVLGMAVMMAVPALVARALRGGPDEFV